MRNSRMEPSVRPIASELDVTSNDDVESESAEASVFVDSASPLSRRKERKIPSRPSDQPHTRYSSTPAYKGAADTVAACPAGATWPDRKIGNTTLTRNKNTPMTAR